MKPQQIKIIKIILFKNNNNVEITIFQLYFIAIIDTKNKTALAQQKCR